MESVPASPAQIDPDGRRSGDAPTPFRVVSGVLHRFRGDRPNGLEGAIVHFDAGRSRPTRGPDDPDWGARAALDYGGRAGFAYATVSRSGTIFLPANMDWQKWGSHAGESRCPATNRTSVSRFYVGFEVNSPGLVYATENPDLFVPWFEAVRGSKGEVLLDRSGRARVKNEAGELYRKNEIRILPRQQGNARAGAYVPFSAAQMEALTSALLWLRHRYPASFRLDRVFGHDEVAPRRKSDPGGCLGAAGEPLLTMAAFRARLAEAEKAAFADTH